MTKRDIQTWAELLQLMARMTLTAIETLDTFDDDDPVDFESVKIRTSPEEALRRARAEAEAEAEPEPGPAAETSAT